MDLKTVRISIWLCAVKLDLKWTKNQVKVIHYCPLWNIPSNMCVFIWSSGINNFNNVNLIWTFYIILQYIYFGLFNEPIISLNMVLSNQRHKYLCQIENASRNVLQDFVEEPYFNVLMTIGVIDYSYMIVRSWPSIAKYD